jgi:LPS-assembly protein
MVTICDRWDGGVTRTGMGQRRQNGGRGHFGQRSLMLGLSTITLLAFASPALAIKEKPLIKPVVEDPAPGTAADFVADKLTYDPKTKTATATGRVVLTYGPYTLVATRVTYNEVSDMFTANGSVELREPNGNVMRSATLELTNRFKQGFARQLKALLTNDVTITADYARRIEGGITIFENAHYTACKDCSTRKGDPLWELVSDETTHLQQEHDLIHINPRLKISGVTVAGLPYIRMADPTVKRRTGWLTPKFHYGKEYGPAVETPFFWAVAPDKDVTFRPRWTAYQGPVGDVEYRQRTATGKFNIRGYGVYELSPRRTTEKDRTRGAVSSKGDFQLNNDWTAGWNGTLASDRTFLSDYDYDNRSISQNEVYLKGLWNRDYVSAQALHFGALGKDVDSGSLPTALPYVTGEHYFDQPILGGELSLNYSAYSISRDDSGTPFSQALHGTSQSRATADLRWKSRYVSDAGLLLTPFANLRSDIYVTNNLADPTVLGGERSQETTTHILPAAGFDLRYPLISNYDYGQGIFSPVFQFIASDNQKNVDQVANEDAVTLNFDSSSLFLEDRFTGYDRYESGVRANVGMTYAFLGNNGGFLKASAGESFHLAGQNSFVTGSGLDGSKSDLVGALTFQPWDTLSLTYQVRAEENLSSVNRQEAFGSLTFDSFAINAAYLNIAAEPAYGRLLKEQWAEADLRIGLTDGWYAFGGARYDIENSFFAKQTLGLEFDCDCMNFKIAYSSNKDSRIDNTDHRVMLSIDLATLGGTSVSTKF